MNKVFKHQTKVERYFYLDLVGKRLSDLRKQQTKSLKAVSKATGISPAMICKMERGKVNFKIAVLLCLCSYYQTTVCHIFQHREVVIDDFP